MFQIYVKIFSYFDISHAYLNLIRNWESIDLFEIKSV